MKLGHKPGIVAALIFLASPAASAADMAILRNGFAIRHERREARETATRLYLSGTPDNYIDVPTADIARFEGLESPLRPAVSSAPPRGLDSVVTAASCDSSSVSPIAGLLTAGVAVDAVRQGWRQLLIRL